MGTLNQWTIIGNVGREPELSYAGNGTAFTRFSVATTQGTGDKRETLWVNVTCFGKTAENMNLWLYRGCQVLCQGYVEKRKYTDKSSNERETWNLIASLVQPLDKKGDREKQQIQPPYTDEPPAPTDDDVPF